MKNNILKPLSMVRIRHQFLTLLLYGFVAIFKIQPLMAQGPSEGKVLMAIFAHPDDEMTVAPMLVKYVEEGAQVYLVVCTDGRYGTNDFSGLEGGDSLVEIRKAEMQCAADALGVTLIHLDYHDQLRAGEGYDGHMPHVKALIAELQQIISDKKPDVLVTWGPDGGSTHMDHRLVGASVNQIFVSKVWEKPSKLFFVGTPSNLIEDPAQKILAGVDPEYLNTYVTYSAEDLDKAMVSLACHKSQIRPEDVQNIKVNRQKSGFQIQLREFVGPVKTRTTIFE
jgi:LmbE family N-acetylglucosaminyl deacetylase